MRIAPCPLSNHNHSHCLVTFAGGDVQAIFSPEAEPQVLGHSSSSSASSSSSFPFERLPLNPTAASLSHLCRSKWGAGICACAAAEVLAAPSLPAQCPFLLCLSSALTCMGILQESPQEEADQEQRLQGGHGARSREKVSACGSLCSGETRVNSQGGGDLFNPFGALAPPLITSPTSFPRPVEFKEFGMIQQKSCLGMFAAFQRRALRWGQRWGMGIWEP